MTWTQWQLLRRGGIHFSSAAPVVETDGALSGFYRYLQRTHWFCHENWSQQPGWQRGNVNLPKEEELLWNKQTPGFFSAEKHNRWKLIHATWRKPRSRAQLILMDGGPDDICCVLISSVGKWSCENSYSRGSWLCSRHKPLTCLALWKSVEGGQFKHTEKADLAQKHKSQGMFALLLPFNVHWLHQERERKFSSLIFPSHLQEHLPTLKA